MKSIRVISIWKPKVPKRYGFRREGEKRGGGVNMIEVLHINVWKHSNEIH
jgi:hypothetical protein